MTGGTGFMGAWVAEAVAHLNDTHRFGIRLSLMSRSAYAFRARVPELADRPDIQLLDKDVQSLVDFPEDVNRVIHAAGTPDSRNHATDPLRTAETIIQGTASVLEACRRLQGLQSVLVVSSASVYGSQPMDQERIREDGFHPLNPSTLSGVYAEAKRASEMYATIYRNQHRLPVVIARPFAFIGPYQALDRPWAVNNFLRDALSNSPVRVLGDGETVRSYMYGADLAAWILSLLAGGERGRAYNVGSEEAIRLCDLAGLILEITGGGGSVILRAGPPGSAHCSRLVPDVTLARQTLGLAARFSLREALARTVEWNRASV
jgi:dTDP-glucose 4,6-dehydratase